MSTILSGADFGAATPSNASTGSSTLSAADLNNMDNMFSDEYGSSIGPYVNLDATIEGAANSLGTSTYAQMVGGNTNNASDILDDASTGISSYLDGNANSFNSLFPSVGLSNSIGNTSTVSSDPSSLYGYLGIPTSSSDSSEDDLLNSSALANNSTLGTLATYSGIGSPESLGVSDLLGSQDSSLSNISPEALLTATPDQLEALSTQESNAQMDEFSGDDSALANELEGSGTSTDPESEIASILGLGSASTGTSTDPESEIASILGLGSASSGTSTDPESEIASILGLGSTGTSSSTSADPFADLLGATGTSSLLGSDSDLDSELGDTASNYGEATNGNELDLGNLMSGDGISADSSSPPVLSLPALSDLLGTSTAATTSTSGTTTAANTTSTTGTTAANTTTTAATTGVGAGEGGGVASDDSTTTTATNMANTPAAGTVVAGAGAGESGGISADNSDTTTTATTGSGTTTTTANTTADGTTTTTGGTTTTTGTANTTADGTTTATGDGSTTTTGGGTTTTTTGGGTTTTTGTTTTAAAPANSTTDITAAVTSSLTTNNANTTPTYDLTGEDATARTPVQNQIISLYAQNGVTNPSDQMVANWVQLDQNNPTWSSTDLSTNFNNAVVKTNEQNVVTQAFAADGAGTPSATVLSAWQTYIQNNPTLTTAQDDSAIDTSITQVEATVSQGALPPTAAAPAATAAAA